MLLDDQKFQQLVQELNDLGLQLAGAENLITDGKHVLCARKIQSAQTKHVNILNILDDVLNPANNKASNSPKETNKN